MLSLTCCCHVGHSCCFCVLLHFCVLLRSDLTCRDSSMYMYDAAIDMFGYLGADRSDSALHQ
jgi:hypothetical protein